MKMAVRRGFAARTTAGMFCSISPKRHKTNFPTIVMMMWCRRRKQEEYAAYPYDPLHDMSFMLHPRTFHPVDKGICFLR